MDTVFSDIVNVDICSERQFEIESEAKLDKYEAKDTVLNIPSIDDISVENKHEEVVDTPKPIIDKTRGLGVLHTEAKTSNEFIKSTQEVIKKKQREELKRLSQVNNEFPYKRVNILTDAELQLFHFMQNNLCQLDRITILTKVRLADIVNVDERITRDKKYLWSITNKHVDFLICKKDDMSVICVVELDDYTHETKEAKDRDLFVMQVLDSVGIRVVRIKTKIRSIEVRDLRLADEYINRALAPKCHYCGRQMYPKESRTGHRFYACEDFINCRETLDIDKRGESLK